MLGGDGVHLAALAGERERVRRGERGVRVVVLHAGLVQRHAVPPVQRANVVLHARHQPTMVVH